MSVFDNSAIRKTTAMSHDVSTCYAINIRPSYHFPSERDTPCGSLFTGIPFEAKASTGESSAFSSVQYTLKHKVLRAQRPAEKGELSIHIKTVLWRWENEHKCSGRLSQMTGAATLKLRLPGSVAAHQTNKVKQVPGSREC